MEVPEDRSYTKDHEWAMAEEGKVRVGITDFAQDALGDIVFVELPEAGQKVSQGGPLGEIESTKSVSQIYAPVAGTVVEVNSALADAPEMVNSEPYGGGWLAVIEPEGEEPLAGLLDAAGYRAISE